MEDLEYKFWEENPQLAPLTKNNNGKVKSAIFSTGTKGARRILT